MDDEQADRFKEDFQINDPDVFNCIKKYYLENLTCQTANYSVHIKPYKLEQESGLELSGRKGDVGRAMIFVKDVVRNIKVEHIQLKEAEYFNTAKGKAFIEDLQNKYNVILNIEDKTPDLESSVRQDSVVPPMYQWTFPKGQQLFICYSRGVESGAKVITEAFVTDKTALSEAFKMQTCRPEGYILVQFPIPKFKEKGHGKLLKTNFTKLIQTVQDLPASTLAVEVDNCSTWKERAFCKAVFTGFTDHICSKMCPPDFKLYICVTKDKECLVARRCCNDVLQKENINKFEFAQIDGPMKKQEKNVKIEVIQGDICTIQADAIVNTTSRDLDLSKGRASRALLQAAGKDLQSNLSHKYNKGLDYGEIGITKGCRLPCKYILHGFLEKYDEKTCSSYETVEDFYKTSVHEFMRNCIEKAVQFDCVSISFPVIGTGSLFYPLYIVAEQMFETVQGLDPQWRLNTVKIVVYKGDQDAFKLFQDCHLKYEKRHTKGCSHTQKQTHGIKNLKIAGTGDGIKTARQKILEHLEESDTHTGEMLGKNCSSDSPKFSRGSKLAIEIDGVEIKDTGSFTGKSASRSQQNLNASKKHNMLGRKSLSSPTSPPLENDGETKIKSSAYAPPFPRNQSPLNEGAAGGSGEDGNHEPGAYDMNVTLTNVNGKEKRDVVMADQQDANRKIIIKVSKLQYDLLEFFQSEIIEKYKKKRCLLTYDEDAIVLYGDLPKSVNVKIVRFDVLNAVKKTTALQSDTVRFQSYDLDEVHRCAARLTSGTVLCVVDEDMKEFTAYSESCEEVQAAVHQVNIELGYIKQSDRHERQFLHTNAYSSEMIKKENIIDRRRPQSAVLTKGDSHGGGARPKYTQTQSPLSKNTMSPGQEKFDIENKLTVHVYQADIRSLPVKCIVNAANKNLHHGGGIARVISEAAGYELNKEGWKYVKEKGDLAVGEVCITTAGNLKYSCVIHAVGPNWNDYRPHSKGDVVRCEKDLYNAVLNSIKRAETLRLGSIAIPGISAGIYACPRELCAVNYARAVLDYGKKCSPDRMVRDIHFVDMNSDVVKHVQATFRAMITNKQKTPLFYDIGRIVAQAQRYIKGNTARRGDTDYARKTDAHKPLDPQNRGTRSRPHSATSDYQHLSGFQQSKPSGKVNEQDRIGIRSGTKPQSEKFSEISPHSDGPKEQSGYPYISKKCPPGYSSEEFVCVVSPCVSLYVYRAGITDNITGVDMIACGETPQGNGGGAVSMIIDKWAELKFREAKKEKFKYAKEGDVVVVVTHKYVAYMVLYQKKQTKDEEDREKKMTEIYMQLFLAAKKYACKGIALALPGSGQGRLGVKYATKRLCEGLQKFTSGNKQYEMTVHLINTDLNKTLNSIETIKSLVDGLKKTDIPVKPPPPNREKTKHKVVNPATTPRQANLQEMPLPGSYRQYSRQRGNNTGCTSTRDVVITKEFTRSSSMDEKEESDPDEYEDISNSEGSEGSELETEDKATNMNDTEKSGDCVICMEKMKSPRRLICGHEFCTDCIEEQFVYKEACPVCGRVCGIIKGDQPEGDMKVTVDKEKPCAGFQGVSGRIEITYHFSDGKQGPDHPNPGRPYKGITRTAYLPNNEQGKQVMNMLKIAFDRKLVFTIGSSRTTGQEGVITWNDIHHKTDPKPNTQFGYPDPGYLDRVTDELAAKGVTEKDIQTAKKK